MRMQVKEIQARETGEIGVKGDDTVTAGDRKGGEVGI